ncbi:helix-turn-helix transcriptional regulator [Microvirga sp. 2MCAF38]|uniref:helix-turn-helix transcriptional regulator n=1 Tax=Microvirga sp. 2MCAF38 TaxID=3232989 RepID=UPI003F99823D
MVPDRWPGVLDKIAQITGSAGGSLFFKAQNRTGTGISEGVAGIYQEWLADVPGRKDTWTPRLRAADGRFSRVVDLYTPDELATDPTYAGFFHPKGFGWCTGMSVSSPDGVSATLQIERRFVSGSIDDKGLALLNHLKPHLSRSIVLYARLGVQYARSVVDALETVGFATAVITRKGVIIAANAAFQNSEAWVVTGAWGRITFRNAHAQSALREMLDQVSRGDPRAWTSVISIPETEDRSAAVARLAPISGEARDVLGDDAVLMMVTPLAGTASTSPEMLRQMFNLTSAEAKLAHALAAGGSLRELAGQWNLSHETLRTQLRSVFSKTNTNRQAQLVGLLGSMPAIQRKA